MQTRPLKKLAGLALVLALTTSCTTIPGTATTGDAAARVCCMAFNPLTYSGEKDTPETILGVRRHNAAYSALCNLEGSGPDG